MSENHNITEMPYAKWLEQSLSDISALPIRGIAIVGITEGGDAYTNYYNTSMADKLVLAGLINQDAMFDSMAANGIIDYEDDDEDDETDDVKEDDV